MTSLAPKSVSIKTWMKSLDDTQIHRFKDVFEIVKRPNSVVNPQVLSLTNKGVIERDISNNEGQVAESYENYQNVHKGDFVLNPMDLLSGWVAISRFEGVISNAYFVFRLRTASTENISNPKFYERVLQSYFLSGILEPFGKGVGRPEIGGGRWTINSETLGTIPLPKFALDQQNQIVSELDRELGHIDELLEKQTELISLLLERRGSLVSETVVSGTGADLSQKDSGISWLGSVPNHWEVVPLWRMFRRSKSTGHETLELLSLYREHGVVPKGSRDDNHNVESEDLRSYQLVRRGDLVVNKMKAWQGSIALSEFEGIVSPAYFVYKPLGNHNSKYFHYLLRSKPYVAEFNRLSKGVRVGQWDLDPNHFRAVKVLIPSREEQNLIVETLDRELLNNTVLMEKSDLVIKRLQERRQALLSASVIRAFDARRHV